MVRIRVVLPEPDGPMMLITSPFSTCRSMPFIDMHVRTLRQKLGAAGEAIRTVRKVGYKLSTEGTDE